MRLMMKAGFAGFAVIIEGGGSGTELDISQSSVHARPLVEPQVHGLFLVLVWGLLRSQTGLCSVEHQAYDRIYRIGQVKPVTIHRLVVKGCVEEKVLKLQQHKETLVSDILEGGASKAANKLSMQEIRVLFS